MIAGNKNSGEGKREFSKSLVDKFVLAWGAHCLATFCAIVFTEKGAQASEFFGVCIPVYLAVFGGYYGKAAIENSKKISALLEPETDSDGMVG